MQKLKLSQGTVQVLKNFNQINPMILFKTGNVISTISHGQTIVATYKSPETFKTDFGINKLDKLLSILTFFAEPELFISENYLTIKDDNQSARITFADQAALEYPKKVPIELPSVEAEFDVTEGEIADITKAFSIMGLPYVAFENDGKKLTLKALDYKNPTGDTYTIELTENTDHDVGGEFTAIFNINNLKLIPSNYHVKISSKGIAEFANGKMTYWVAVEKDSNFA